MKGKEKITYHN